MDGVPLHLPTNGTSEICKAHGFKVVENAFKGARWALQMLDSSSKIPEYLLVGNIFDFGSYDECLDVEVNETWGSFRGQHCLTEFIIPKSIAPVAGIKGPGIPTFWSVCIPSTCTPQDLQYGLSKINENFYVEPSLCNMKHDPPPFGTLDWIAIVVFSILGLCCVLSTAYDLIVYDKERRNKKLLVFSWYSNGRSLFSTSIGEEAMEALHGIRFLSMVLIIMGHVGAMSLADPSINMLLYVAKIKTMSHIYMGNVPLAVDTFFVLSGLLLSYVFLKLMDSGKPFNIPIFYLHRFLRVTPVLGTVVLIHLTFHSRLGNGPFWNFAIEKIEKQYCIDHWWSTMLFVQNYVNLGKVCITTSWFLAVDMQLYWISPIILLPLHRRPKIGLALIGVAFLIGLGLTFHGSYIHRDDPNLGKPGTPDLGYTYFHTHTRYNSWLIGILSGYLMHRTSAWRKKVAAGTAKLSKTKIVCGWSLTTAVFFGVIFSLYPFEQTDYKYNPVEVSFYYALAHPAWSLCILWLIFACVSGYGGILNTILSWPAFRPLSRLSFCIYLIHYDVIYGRIVSGKMPVYNNSINLFAQVFEALVLTVLLAIVMTLTVESPNHLH